MRKRVLYILLAGTLAIALATAVTLPTASADLTTVNVTLSNGTTVPVQVDVPPGTPLENVTVPTVSTPTVPVPTVPSAPTGGGGGNTGSGGGNSGGGNGTSTSGGNSGGGGNTTAGGNGTTTNGQATQPNGTTTTSPTGTTAPTGTTGAQQRKSKKHAPTLDVTLTPDKGDTSNDSSQPMYGASGAPSSANPTFMDALLGPAKVTSVPNFVIRQFHVPLFLLPIYQAAGIQYGIRWEVLAAINEIETDYGRNLNVSSAGAVGWMQFLPSTWKTWGVDGNHDGRKDPYNPVDAIFSAARYLKAAGGQKDLNRAIFAYNHAGWYVDSVILRARLIAGVPSDVIGSLTGLTEGRFPVYANARYADDMAIAKAGKKVKVNQNAAQLIESSITRKGINIFAKKGSPVIATQDGVIKKMGTSKTLGHYIILQDAYGNQYIYSGLGELAHVYPVPKNEAQSGKTVAKALTAKTNAKPPAEPKLPKPTAPASAGLQKPTAAVPAAKPAAKAKVPLTKKIKINAAGRAPVSQSPATNKERLFAHPSRPGSNAAGGLEQLFNSQATKQGFSTFQNYFSKALGLNAKNSRFKRLRAGAHVVGGTILGRVGQSDPTHAAHMFFQIRPTGKGAPLIDPKPILDGWKLLEATAIYRASGKDALYSKNGSNLSIGQVMLLPKPQLQQRVLSDSRISIYPCGRDDIRTGQIDRRVLATLEYLADSGLSPTVSALKCGHSYLTSSGNVSEHSSGNAVDIAAINGIPIAGHQDPGGITEITVRRLMLLQGTMMPHQIISLLDLGGNTMSLPDHWDHIHVGFRPLFGTNAKAGREALTVLKPNQWNNLIDRLREIQNPVVPVDPSKYAIPVQKSGKGAAAGDD
jgi:transglycosylase-like protein with SLT domain/peptidase M23-like protein